MLATYALVILCMLASLSQLIYSAEKYLNALRYKKIFHYFITNFSKFVCDYDESEASYQHNKLHHSIYSNCLSYFVVLQEVKTVLIKKGCIH